jgi:G3E family GTPase
MSIAHEPRRAAGAKLPVTVLSGFLGAGKTTLLQRVLANTDGLKVAVIVNDMSVVNIDAKLVRNTELSQSSSSSSVNGGEVHRIAEKLIEMQNGCVCCSLREDLLEAVAGLAREGRFDYCLIESTGISEPLPVAETFTFEMEDGSSLADVATLDTMVTVVDASAFLGELQKADALAERGLANDEEDERTISELMVSQVEFANVLLVNKVDLVQPAALTELEALLRRLNPDAQLLRTERGNVDIKRVMGTGLFDFDKAAEAPGWLKVCTIVCTVFHGHSIIMYSVVHTAAATAVQYKLLL